MEKGSDAVAMWGASSSGGVIGLMGRGQLTAVQGGAWGSWNSRVVGGPSGVEGGWAGLWW